MPQPDRRTGSAPPDCLECPGVNDLVQCHRRFRESLALVEFPRALVLRVAARAVEQPLPAGPRLSAIRPWGLLGLRVKSAGSNQLCSETGTDANNCGAFLSGQCVLANSVQKCFLNSFQCCVRDFACFACCRENWETGES